MDQIQPNTRWPQDFEPSDTANQSAPGGVAVAGMESSPIQDHWLKRFFGSPSLF